MSATARIETWQPSSFMTRANSRLLQRSMLAQLAQRIRLQRAHARARAGENGDAGEEEEEEEETVEGLPARIVLGDDCVVQ